MLGNYWVPKREQLVTDIEYTAIRDALNRRFNVIVDATNFNPKTLNFIEEIAKATNFQIDILYKEFKIPLKTAIWRDWKRGLLGGRKVGKKVITNFYSKYYG